MAHARAPAAGEAAQTRPTPNGHADRPKTSHVSPFQNLLRSSVRKRSLNDLGSPALSATASPSMLAIDLSTDANPDLLKTLPAIDDSEPRSKILQRGHSLRERGNRRARSSFSNWFNSLSDFRLAAGSRLKARGHTARKSMGAFHEEDGIERASGFFGLKNKGTSSKRLRRPSDLAMASAAPLDFSSPASNTNANGRWFGIPQAFGGTTWSPLPLADREDRIKQPQLQWNGGDGARAAAAAASALTRKTREADVPETEEVLWTDGPSATRRFSSESDTESGIEVNIGSPSRDKLVAEPHIARQDPSAMPTEIFSKILSCLDSASLLRAHQVSRNWHAAASSDHVWKHVFRAEFVEPVLAGTGDRGIVSAGGFGLGKASGHQEWKKMWRARERLEQRWKDGHAAAIYLEGHKDSVYCSQFDEDKIITGSRDWTVRIWDAYTLRCTHVLGVAKDSNPEHNAITDRKQVGKQPFAELVPAGPHAAPVNVVSDRRHTGSVLCLQYDETILVTGSSDSTLIVRSMNTGDFTVLAHLCYHTLGVLDICFNEKYIVACSKDQNISVWSRETYELSRVLQGHRGPVNAVQMRGNLICSASGDGIAKLWDIKTGLCIKEFLTPSPAPNMRARGLACVDFTKDGRTVLAGGNDKTIYQFDTTSGNMTRAMVGHEALVRSLHYDAANGRVISGSYDHSVKAFDIETGELICDFQDWTTSWMLSAKADYRRIVATSQDARAVVIDFGFHLPDIELLDSTSRPWDECGSVKGKEHVADVEDSRQDDKMDITPRSVISGI